MLKGIVLSGLLAITAFDAFAGTALFKYERIDGLYKICVYDYLGSEVAITIKSVDLCPISIEVM